MRVRPAAIPTAAVAAEPGRRDADLIAPAVGMFTMGLVADRARPEGGSAWTTPGRPRHPDRPRSERPGSPSPAGVAPAAPPMLTRPLYRLYEARLLRRLQRGPLPRHVGLILDGNRRYAHEAGLPGHEAYRRGADKVDEVIDWCEALGIPQVTVWVLSIENLTRASEDLQPLLEVIEQKIRNLTRHPATARRRRRIRVLGRLDLLPAPLRHAIADATRVTAGHDGCLLNIAVGYSGRQEIADAVRALVRERFRPSVTVEDLVAHITPEGIARHLYSGGGADPDLIIRTSGEVRLSGFLLWQSAHSEFYFCDVYWPAFRKVDFLRALRSYQQRQRRFGR